MVSIVASFLFSVYFLSGKGYERAENFKDYSVAYHAAASAVKMALKFLEEDDNGFDGEGDDWARPIFYNYRGITISLRIKDECGMLNVNKLTDTRYYKIARRLFQELEIDPDTADALKDWVDPDSEPSWGGAESEYYRGIGYLPTNGKARSLGEIRYIKGINDRLFKKLENFLTTYGNGKINVNSAPKALLTALSPQMTEEAADSIIEARPVKKLSDLKELPGFSEELYFEIRPLITNKCDFFRIEATASFGEAVAVVKAFTDRHKILEWKVVQ